MPRWLRRSAVALAALFLSLVWLDAVGTGIWTAVPGPARFFCQVAQLFPHAAEQIIEWHAEGYRCATGRFEELDVAPYFPIHAGDKESTFDRALFFYFKERKVQRALDAYLSANEARRGVEQKIGGVMLMSVRLPLPEAGNVAECYQRHTLAEQPANADRHYWYVTGADERARRCGEARP